MTRRFATTQRRAFTLIEVLASILILVIVLPILMQGLTLSTKAAGLARHRTQATTLAQSKLNELLATGEWQDITEGDFGEQWPEYRWTAETAVFDSPTADGLVATLEELHLTVTWKQRNQDQNVTLSTLIYQSASTNIGGLP